MHSLKSRNVLNPTSLVIWACKHDIINYMLGLLHDPYDALNNHSWWKWLNDSLMSVLQITYAIDAFLFGCVWNSTLAVMCWKWQWMTVEMSYVGECDWRWHVWQWFYKFVVLAVHSWIIFWGHPWTTFLYKASVRDYWIYGNVHWLKRVHHNVSFLNVHKISNAFVEVSNQYVYSLSLVLHITEILLHTY